MFSRIHFFVYRFISLIDLTFLPDEVHTMPSAVEAAQMRKQGAGIPGSLTPKQEYGGGGRRGWEMTRLFLVCC